MPEPNATPPAEPGWITKAHAERQAQRDLKAAADYASDPVPAAPTAPPPLIRKAAEPTTVVVSRTVSGAKLETVIGLEPRSDVRPGPSYEERRFARDRERLRAANLRRRRR
jgi:hypothetical protein